MSNCSVEVIKIGSSSNDTCNSNSSLDLVLKLQSFGNEAPSRPKIEVIKDLLRLKTDSFSRVESSERQKIGELSMRPCFHTSHLVTEDVNFASLYPVSFVDNDSGVTVALRINDEEALRSSKLINTNCFIRPSLVKPLLYFIKTWAEARGLGAFDSYLLSLMVIWSLQQWKHLPNIQNDSFRASTSQSSNLDLNFTSDLSEFSKWTQIENSTPRWKSDEILGEAVHSFFKHFSSPRTISLNLDPQFQASSTPCLIRVQDPFNPSHLLTDSISKFSHQEFTKEILKAKQSLEIAANVSRIIRPLGWENGLKAYRKRYDEEKKREKRYGKRKETEVEKVETRKDASREQDGTTITIPSGPASTRGLDPRTPTFTPRSYAQVATSPNITSSPITTVQASISSAKLSNKERRLELERDMTSSERTQARRERRERAKAGKSTGYQFGTC